MLQLSIKLSLHFVVSLQIRTVVLLTYFYLTGNWYDLVGVVEILHTKSMLAEK